MSRLKPRPTKANRARWPGQHLLDSTVPAWKAGATTHAMARQPS
jgi:hypothetical protein